LQYAFPLDVPMVHSSVLTVSTDGERLTCDGFSLGEIIHFGSPEFIAIYFNGLSLYPRGDDSGASFMGSTRNGSPSLRSMIEDSTEEFYMASSGDGWGGTVCSHHNHTMARGHSGHSGHNDDSTVGTGVAARTPAPLQAMMQFSKEATSASPRSVGQCQALGSAMVKQHLWQASNNRSPTARADARGGEDPNGGPCCHPSLGQGSGFLRSP
jgi:hypothetical protein